MFTAVEKLEKSTKSVYPFLTIHVKIPEGKKNS